MRLSAKLFLSGQIRLVTGLSIGGSKNDVAIGGIEDGIVTTSEGVPFIPGSSLKGKLRSLAERREGEETVCSCGKADCPICTIFGAGIKTDKSQSNDSEIKSGPTRLYVRDAYLNNQTREDMNNRVGQFTELEFKYTESKWENTISRKTSRADNPRQIERVPAGACFDFNMVYNIYGKQDIDNLTYLLDILDMLEDDYLGGKGSRGYGQIAFEKLSIKLKTLNNYESNNKAEEFVPEVDTIAEVMEIVNSKKEELKTKISSSGAGSNE